MSRLIALDGGDLCGKSTQLKLLNSYLTGIDLPVTQIKCPIDYGIGGVIRRLVLGQEVSSRDGLVSNRRREDVELPSLNAGRFLFLSEYLDTYEKYISPAIKNDHIVLLDRSHLVSNIAYGLGLGVDSYVTEMIKLMQISLTKAPDLCIVLLVPYEEVMVRLEKRQREGGEVNHFDVVKEETFNRRVRGFEECAKEFDWVRIIKANGTKEDVHLRIRREVNKIL